jgi:hypothetical protein
LRNSRDVKRAVTVGDAARAPAEQRENT